MGGSRKSREPTTRFRTQIDVLVSRKERDRAAGQGRHPAARLQQQARQGRVRLDEFAASVGRGVVAAIRERHVEIGLDAVAADRDEAAAALSWERTVAFFREYLA